MDSHQITKPFLIVVCYVLLFFLLLVVACIIPTMTFATLDSSSNQPEPGPQMQLPPQPQPDFQPFNEEPLPTRPRHLVLNLTEQITFQEITENTPSPFELTISSDQRSANIVVGDTAQATLNVGLASGNTQSVSLSCNLSPPSSQASCNISPSTVTPVGTATLTIATQDTISPGQYTATITATPEQGVNQTTNFVVVVDAKPDTDLPVISVPSSTIQANASGPSGAQVQYQASATDNVDGPINVTCTPLSGSTFPIGETIVECSATDAAGNTGTASFTITIQDATPPAISVPDDIPAEATGPNGVQVPFEVSAQDNVDGEVEVSCDYNSGETFPIGETVVTCNTVDAAGNEGTASFTVTVNPAPDTTPPVITVPAEDITVEATSEEGAVVAYTVSAQDNVDGEVEVSCDYNSGETFPIGTTTVTCSATDRAGNTATASFTVTVTDTTAPVISAQDITAEATNSSGAAISYTATATDAVDGDSVPVICNPASNSIFSIGTTTVTCSALDAAGNEGTASFTVTVNPAPDTTPPDITIPEDITAEATNAQGAKISFEVSAQDNVDGEVEVSCDYNSGETFPIGETVVTCKATDSSGNPAEESFTITTVVGPVTNENTSQVIFIIIPLIIAAIVAVVVVILLIRRRMRSKYEGTQAY